MAIKMLNSRVGTVGGFTTAGVVFSDNGAIIIDNGWGRKQGERILSELEAVGKKLIAIINTHAHLDHAGANYFLQKKTGCAIYCTLYESLMVRGDSRIFASLFGGTMCPIPDGLEIMRTFDFPTEPTLIKAGQPLTVDGVTFDIIDLPGHSDGHVGIVVDDIIFVGDLVMGSDALAKTKMMFIPNPPLQRKSLEKLKKTSYSLYVPAHGSAFTRPEDGCDPIIAMMDRIDNLIFECISEKPATFEKILKFVMDNSRIHARALHVYDTVRTSLSGYVNGLILADKIDYFYEDNMMYYKILKEGEVRAAKQAEKK